MEAMVKEEVMANTHREEDMLGMTEQEAHNRCQQLQWNRPDQITQHLHITTVRSHLCCAAPLFYHCYCCHGGSWKPTSSSSLSSGHSNRLWSASN